MRAASAAGPFTVVAAIALASNAMPAIASEADRATAPGHASAMVVKPITVAALADLSFGAIAVGENATGTVVVSASGAPVRYTGSARAGGTSLHHGIPHPATFSIAGDPGRSYRVSVPRSILAKGSRTGRELPVTRLVLRSANAPSASAGGRLDDDGRDLIDIGGTLSVPAGTLPDVFRSELPVVVTYD